MAPGNEFAGTVRAISAQTGETVWLHEQRAGTLSLVATGGGLVFGGDVNGRFRAFDQETGEVLSTPAPNAHPVAPLGVTVRSDASPSVTE